MTAYQLSANTNIDALASKGGGDTYDTYGFTLTIDQDSRVGLNQSTSASLGSITVNATRGGKVEIDGRYVRIIPYNTGTGNVPAWNTAISQGGASGLLIGVYSSLTAASTATGAAMPASGWIKIKQWNGTAFAAGALTGIGATATGADVVGWLDLVGDEAATINANRLGEVNIRGAWFALGTTSGASNQTVQIPNSGLLRYGAGVFIEQNAGQGDYEFYPNAGTTTTTGTEAARGKCVWIDNTGLVRIGNSGAATNGYTPAAGLAIVIGNVFCENCTTAARTANVIPNATVATRYDFTCTGGGVVTIDKANVAWYCSFAQPFSVQLTNMATIDALLLQECASPVAWSKVGVGNKPTTALSAYALTLSLDFAGGTMTDCVWQRVNHGSSGNYTCSFADIEGFTFVRDTMRCGTIRGNATTGSLTCTRAVSCTWTDPRIVQGRMLFTTCSDVSATGTIYVDCISGTTVTTYAMYVWSLASNCQDVLLSGLTLPVTGTQPYTALLDVGAAGCTRIRFRNVGTRASPLSLSSGGNFTGLVFALAGGAAATDLKVQRVYCSGTRTNLMTGDNSSSRVTLENVAADYADAPLAAVLNYQIKALGCTQALTAQTSVYGTHWYDCYTSTTAGRLGLLMDEKTAELPSADVYEITAGGAAFTSAGGLYMPTVGDQIVYEVPYWILGHTSFQNSAPVMAGGTASNYLLEYQIDKNDGNGYGAWTTMSAANLSGETGIDASLGFKMRWRITTSTANTTAITSLYVLTNSTTTAQDYQYPLDPVTVRVTALAASTLAPIESARAYLEAGAGGPLSEGTLILSELTDSAGVAEDTAFAYTADQPVVGRARKGSSSPYYKTSPLTGTITEDGLSLTAYLVGDE